MKPIIILSSSDYSDSYDEKKSANMKKNLNTTDSESETDEESGEKVVIKTFHPNKTVKKPILPPNRFFRRPKLNVKIFDIRFDESSSDESYYYSYSYDEEDKNHTDHVKTKITKNNIKNEKPIKLSNLNEENSDNDDVKQVESQNPEENDQMSKNKVNINKNQKNENKNDQINENQFKNEEIKENENNENSENQIITDKNQQKKIENDKGNLKNHENEQIDNSENQIITNKNNENKNDNSDNQIITNNNDNKTDEYNQDQIQNKEEKLTEDKEDLINSNLNEQIQNKENEMQTNEKEKGNEEEDEDEINPPIIKLNVFQPKPSITYSIVRTVESSLLTKNYKYSFYLESLQKFYTKVKVRNPEQRIPLFEGPTVNFKKKPSYSLITDKEFKTFSLKESDKSDDDLLNLKVCFDPLLALPRHLDIQIFTSPEISLTTKNPKVSMRGHWVLDFNGKFTIPSERNMIFVSAKEKDGDDLIFVRQISNDELEIDLCTDMDEIFVFAIGISIFIARLS